MDRQNIIERQVEKALGKGLPQFKVKVEDTDKPFLVDHKTHSELASLDGSNGYSLGIDQQNQGDDFAALKHFGHAALKGHGNAIYELAKLCEKLGKTETALAYYRESFARGVPQAGCQIALFYEKGQAELPTNYEIRIAAVYLELARLLAGSKQEKQLEVDISNYIFNLLLRHFTNFATELSNLIEICEENFDNFKKLIHSEKPTELIDELANSISYHWEHIYDFEETSDKFHKDVDSLVKEINQELQPLTIGRSLPGIEKTIDTLLNRADSLKKQIEYFYVNTLLTNKSVSLKKHVEAFYYATKEALKKIEVLSAKLRKDKLLAQANTSSAENFSSTDDLQNEILKLESGENLLKEIGNYEEEPNKEHIIHRLRAYIESKSDTVSPDNRIKAEKFFVTLVQNAKLLENALHPASPDVPVTFGDSTNLRQLTPLPSFPSDCEDWDQWAKQQDIQLKKNVRLLGEDLRLPLSKLTKGYKISNQIDQHIKILHETSAAAQIFLNEQQALLTKSKKYVFKSVKPTEKKNASSSSISSSLPLEEKQIRAVKKPYKRPKINLNSSSASMSSISNVSSSNFWHRQPAEDSLKPEFSEIADMARWFKPLLERQGMQLAPVLRFYVSAALIFYFSESIKNKRLYQMRNNLAHHLECLKGFTALDMQTAADRLLTIIIEADNPNKGKLLPESFNSEVLNRLQNWHSSLLKQLDDEKAKTLPFAQDLLKAKKLYDPNLNLETQILLDLMNCFCRSQTQIRPQLDFSSMSWSVQNKIWLEGDAMRHDKAFPLLCELHDMWERQRPELSEESSPSVNRLTALINNQTMNPLPLCSN